MLLQRLELGTKQQQSATPGPVEWLNSDAVADQPEPAVPAIPKGEDKHSGEFLQRAFDTPRGARLQQDFGIRMASEVHLRKVSGDIGGIVDFPVVGDDKAAVCTRHRLNSAELTQIDDCQPAMAERDPAVGVDPGMDVVGSPMCDGIGHGARLGRKVLGTVWGRGPDSCYPAHWSCLVLLSSR